MNDFSNEMLRRRTFAIISHPDAGKTTITEKLLFAGGAIQVAGSVKSRKSSRHATSDWMELEKQRGISVTTSVMQIPYREHVVNLLDTPGHADFSEDTYRTLTAVDSALMVIDAAKGVEPRTIKLMEVCRLRATPILTFVNKLDRESLEPIEILDNIESVLNIGCAPITWPIGSGKRFKGAYHLIKNQIIIYKKGEENKIIEGIDGASPFDNPQCKAELDEDEQQRMRDEIELIQAASNRFDLESYLKGEQTPVYFGTALNDFGITDILDALVDYAPAPQPRATRSREVEPTESKMTGFVFKIQANMDPAHHDRIAFLRITSGSYEKGIRLKQIRTGKITAIHDAMMFMAGSRQNVDCAYPGDIIGLHNHGTIRIGDTFTEGENLQFIGIPNFAPELFRQVILDDPLKQKALLKGLQQLSEEGATQYFKPFFGGQMILGAIGILQFDVVAHRLAAEYRVKCHYDSANIAAARWVTCDDEKELEKFKQTEQRNCAYDASEDLIYLAPSRINLELTQERWPDISFHDVREHD